MCNSKIASELLPVTVIYDGAGNWDQAVREALLSRIEGRGWDADAASILCERIGGAIQTVSAHAVSGDSISIDREPSRGNAAAEDIALAANIIHESRVVFRRLFGPV